MNGKSKGGSVFDLELLSKYLYTCHFKNMDVSSKVQDNKDTCVVSDDEDEEESSEEDE